MRNIHVGTLSGFQRAKYAFATCIFRTVRAAKEVFIAAEILWPDLEYHQTWSNTQ